VQTPGFEPLVHEDVRVPSREAAAFCGLRDGAQHRSDGGQVRHAPSVCGRRLLDFPFRVADGGPKVGRYGTEGGFRATCPS
jgi:hypothetical protein